MQLLMILLTILMVSNVRYATFPRAGMRTVKGVLGLATILFIVVFGILEHDAFFFPLGITYMVYGILRATLLGFFFEEDDDGNRHRGPDRDRRQRSRSRGVRPPATCDRPAGA